MKFYNLLLGALAVLPTALAVDEQKSAIVWFDDPSTPDSVVDAAKDNMIKAGGKITHTYSIIKGFSVVAPAKALEVVSSWGEDHSIRVEEDETVSVSS